MIKKLLSFMTGGSKTSRDIFDKENGHLKNFGSWIGNLSFTQEEMAKLDAKTAEGVRAFAVDTLSENTARSIARRELAIFIIKFYAILLFMSGMLYKFDPEWSLFWLRIATETQIGVLVSGVGLFFWGTHALRSYTKKD